MKKFPLKMRTPKPDMANPLTRFVKKMLDKIPFVRRSSYNDMVRAQSQSLEECIQYYEATIDSYREPVAKIVEHASPIESEFISEKWFDGPRWRWSFSMDPTRMMLYPSYNMTEEIAKYEGEAISRLALRDMKEKYHQILADKITKDILQENPK